MARKAVTLKIEGTKDLERKLRRLGRKAFTELEDIVKDASEVLVQEMKNRAPVDTGAMRDGLHASKAFGKKGTVAFDVGPDKDGFYAMYAEFGTRFLAKKPFMRPAADAKEVEIVNELARGLNKVLSSEDE
jgi:HK97 gp10 family phage protein